MRTALFSVMIAIVFPAWATASEPRPLGHRGLDVDIEDLDAEIRWDGEKWRLVVEYDVEIENSIPGEAFDLILNLVSRSRPGQPVQIVVPLVTPTEVDDDELEYESSVVARIDPALIGEPDRLRLEAMVIRRGGGEVLDSDHTSVDYKR